VGDAGQHVMTQFQMFDSRQSASSPPQQQDVFVSKLLRISIPSKYPSRPTGI
jgi:hypothetical protein